MNNDDEMARRRVAIICPVCGKNTEAVILEMDEQSHRWVSAPDGWFADTGLADTGAVVCSLDCARRFDC